MSVILASQDGAEAIEARVHDLFAGSFPAERLEVVVALDAARARATPGRLAHLGPRVTVLVGDAPGGKASSLNAAVRVARHELLVFTDTAQRFLKLSKAEAAVLIDQPVVPVFFYVRRFLVKSYVSGFEENPRGLNLSRWISVAK